MIKEFIVIDFELDVRTRSSPGWWALRAAASFHLHPSTNVNTAVVFPEATFIANDVEVECLQKG